MVLEVAKSKIKVGARWVLNEGRVPGLQTASLYPHVVETKLFSLPVLIMSTDSIIEAPPS
jgi:hypothetical protein